MPGPTLWTCWPQAGPSRGQLGLSLLAWLSIPSRDLVLWEQEEMLWGRNQDSRLLLSLGCPWMGGCGMTCAHLGTGLMHLASECLGCCLLLLPPLALQHLEEGAGVPCRGAGDLKTWYSSRDTPHSHCLTPQAGSPRPLPSVPGQGS